MIKIDKKYSMKDGYNWETKYYLRYLAFISLTLFLNVQANEQDPWQPVSNVWFDFMGLAAESNLTKRHFL